MPLIVSPEIENFYENTSTFFRICERRHLQCNEREYNVRNET